MSSVRVKTFADGAPALSWTDLNAEFDAIAAGLNGIHTADINDGAVIEEAIGVATVISSKFAAGTVISSNKIADGAVTGAKIPDGDVTSLKLGTLMFRLSEAIIYTLTEYKLQETSPVSQVTLAHGLLTSAGAPRTPYMVWISASRRREEMKDPGAGRPPIITVQNDVKVGDLYTYFHPIQPASGLKIKWAADNTNIYLEKSGENWSDPTYDYIYSRWINLIAC